MKKSILKGSALVLVGALALSSCKDPEGSFTADKTTAEVGENITFMDSHEKMKNMELSYDFGDGSMGYGYVVTHAYWKAGTYKVHQIVKKTKNSEKGKGKVGTGTVDITVSAAAAKMEKPAGTYYSGEVLTFLNKTEETGKGASVSYQWSIQGDNVNTTWWSNKDLVWTPSTAGKYTITLYAMQGNSKTIATETIDVLGVGSNVTAGLVSGKWSTIAVTGSFSGNAYTTTCGGGAPSPIATYKNLTMNGTGSSLAERTFPTSQAGNWENPGFSVSVINEGYASLSGVGSIVANSASTGGFEGSLNGIYKMTASEGTITFTKTETNSGGTCGYTETITITLTR